MRLDNSSSWPDDEMSHSNCDASGRDSYKETKGEDCFLDFSAAVFPPDDEVHHESSFSSVDVTRKAEAPKSPQSPKRVRFALQDGDEEGRANDRSIEVQWPCRGGYPRSASSPNYKRQVSLSSTLKLLLQLVLDEPPDVRITSHALQQVMIRYAQAQCEIARLQERVEELEREFQRHPSKLNAPESVSPQQETDAMALAQSRRHSRLELREARSVQEARIVELLQSTRRPEPSVLRTAEPKKYPHGPLTISTSLPSQWSSSLVDLDLSICSSDDVLSPSVPCSEKAATRDDHLTVSHFESQRHKARSPSRKVRLSEKLSRLRCRSQREDESDSTTLSSSNEDSRSNGTHDASLRPTVAFLQATEDSLPHVEDDEWGVRLHL